MKTLGDIRPPPTGIAGPTVVIGVGNLWRGDDGAGLLVARLLRDGEGSTLGPMHICEARGGNMALIEAWAGAGAVFLIDAVLSGAEPGTIHRIELGSEPLPATLFRDSTHAFGVVEAVELARVLGRLPARLVIYGIEGRSFDHGTELSPEVAAATREAAAMIQRELAEG